MVPRRNERQVSRPLRLWADLPGTARQITEAFPWDSAPKYLIRDNDRAFGVAFRVRGMETSWPIRSLAGSTTVMLESHFRKRQLMRQENEASRRQQYGATGLQQRLLGNGHRAIPSRRRLRRPLGRRQRPVAPRFPHTIPRLRARMPRAGCWARRSPIASGCRLPRRPARKPHAHPAQFAPVPRLASLPMRRSPFVPVR